MKSEETGPADIDPAAVRRVLLHHPVKVGVLFGSHVDETMTAESDVDVAVVFKDDLSRDERHQARLNIIVDLMETLGRNDVDVIDLKGTRPAVSASALQTGIVLVGDEERINALCEDFETRRAESTHEERMRRFDELLDRLEEAV